MLRGKGMAASDDQKPQNTLDGRLTSIHPAYTLAATPEASEVDQLTVKHFIETIAEVALAVASRKIADQEQPR